MSRITGSVTVAQICQISGLSKAQTHRSLDRLWKAGLISVPGQSASAPPSTPQRSPQPPPSPQVSRPAPEVPAAPKIGGGVDLNFGAQPVAASTPETASPPPQARASEDEDWSEWLAGWGESWRAFAPDEARMSEATQLEPEQKRVLLFMAHHMRSVDYYTLLGVSRDATRKEIKSRYFKLSKRFHPDLFYGKETGSFGAMIDDVFHHINLAHEALGKKKRRVEYDRTLAAAAPSPHTGGLGAASSSAVLSGPSTNTLEVERSSPVTGSLSGLSTLSEGSSAGTSQRKREMAFAMLVKRGDKHEAASDFLQAANEYRKAFAVKHDAGVAMKGANLLMRLGSAHVDDAIMLAQAAAKENPKLVKPLILIGDAYEEKGDYDRARHYYERAQGLDPSNRVVAKRLKYLMSVADGGA